MQQVPRSPFHLLVIRFSSLGDVVLSSSVVAAIKRRWGTNIHITYLTSHAFVALLAGSPYVDDLRAISRHRGVKGLRELHQLVTQIHHDRPVNLMMDMHGTLRSLFLRLSFPHIPRIFIDKRTLERWCLTTLKIDFLSMQRKQGVVGEEQRASHWGELLLRRNIRDFAEIFDLPTDFNTALPLSFVGKVGDEVPSFCREKNYIVVVPTASFAEKRWPVDSFLALLRMSLQHPDFQKQSFVLLAGPEDNFCRAFDILQQEFPERFFNLQGKTSLAESTAILKKSLCVVGNDTGLPHVAEAMGVPVLVILGPTGEEFGFYPHLPKSDAVFLRMWCRPCTTNGKGNCIRRERYCLTHLKVETVFERLLHLYQRALS